VGSGAGEGRGAWGPKQEIEGGLGLSISWELVGLCNLGRTGLAMLQPDNFFSGTSGSHGGRAAVKATVSPSPEHPAQS
jgi:hypothetical protein